MKASQLMHMPVVSLNGGVKVGNVTDITLEPTNAHLGALLLAAPGGNSMVPFRSIRRIGTDAVTIEDSGMLQVLEGPGGNKERGIATLTGMPVVNQEGTIIGTVKDLDFDVTDGHLVALLVQRGGVLGIGAAHEAIPGAAIRKVGEKLITVETAVPPSASTVG